MSSSRCFATAVVLALAAIGFVPRQLASGTTPPPPPTIVLPAAGATVSGSVVLDATAPAGTTSMEFGLFQWNGMSHQPFFAPVAYALTPTYYGWIANWNTTNVPNGRYDLFAAATVNGRSDSTPVSTLTTNITVDNPLPSVSIGTANGTILSGTEDLTANVPHGATVSFLLTGPSGTTYLGESWDQASGGTYPYSLSWNSTTVPNGYYFLEAVAEYSGGLSNAASVGVAVNNS